VLRRLLVIEPGFAVQSVTQLAPFNRAADVAYYLAGLRLAGVSEGRNGSA
jgi:hypothetical protein